MSRLIDKIIKEINYKDASDVFWELHDMSYNRWKSIFGMSRQSFFCLSDEKKKAVFKRVFENNLTNDENSKQVVLSDLDDFVRVYNKMYSSLQSY